MPRRCARSRTNGAGWGCSAASRASACTDNPAQADPELARFLLFDALTTAIGEAAANQQLPLVVDDLHWADQGSRRLLAAIRGGQSVLRRRSDPDRVAVLTEALDAQPEGDSTARAALLGRLSFALAFTEATPERREALSSAAVARARRLGDPAVLAAALAARCDAISDPDHISERRGAATEIVSLTQPGGDRATEMLGRRLLVVALAEAAEWSQVDAEISAYARQAERLAQPSLNDSRVGRGWLLIVLCRFSMVLSGPRVPGGWRCCPMCPGRHRLRLRRDGPPFLVAGTGWPVRRVRAGRTAVASRPGTPPSRARSG